MANRLIAITTLLVLFGLAMLASAGSAVGFARFGDSYYFLKHQFVFGVLPGIVLFSFFYKVPYVFWKKYALHCLIFSVFLLILVFLPGISAGIGTAHSWISIGHWFSVQPSELVKLTFLFYLAAWLESRQFHKKGDEKNGSFAPFALALSIILGLLILQPDVGTMSIIAAMSLCVYFLSGAPIAHVAGFVLAAGAGLAMLIGFAPYRAARFMTFLNPELDPQGIGYHINQALLAVGSGGMFGLGYGHSRQKFQYLPEATNDSIFAVMAEELGFFACLGLLVLFLAFFKTCLDIGKDSQDQFGRLVCMGVASWLVIQAFVNIASMLSLMPMTGIPLPFISYGGTSMAVALGAVGVVANIANYGKQKER